MQRLLNKTTLATAAQKLLKVRPLEWSLLAFVLFVLVKVGPGVFSAWEELAGSRSAGVASAFLLVVFVALLRRALIVPWPPGSSGLRKLLLAIMPLTLAPLGFAVWAALSQGTLLQTILSASAVDAFSASGHALLLLAGFGLLPLLLWLSLVVFLKERGRLQVGEWFFQTVRAAATAVRDWAPLLLVLSAYAWMTAVIEGAPAPERDRTMAAIDRWMFFGHDPLDLLQLIIYKPLSEWLAFSYSFYGLLYPLVFGAIYMFAGRRALLQTCWMVGTALLIAYVCYTYIPVKGPLLTRSFSVSLEYYLIGPVKAALMDATRITWDCFPSMHTCVTMLLAWCAFKYVRRLFWFIAPMAFSVPLACVYLRYHYLTDVISGLALAALIIWAGRYHYRLIANVPESRPPARQETSPR